MYQKKDYERAIHLVANRQLNLAPMVTHRFAFEDYLAAYEMIESSKGEYIKVMIDL
jgi:threonine dehydrogenase-like Zn-dependent dehydrogenase